MDVLNKMEPLQRSINYVDANQLQELTADGQTKETEWDHSKDKQIDWIAGNDHPKLLVLAVVIKPSWKKTDIRQKLTA